MKKIKEEDEEKWSQLPTLLLWMIKDQLTNLVHHFRLGLVCKNWKAANESYPMKHPQECVVPWLMQRSVLSFHISTECDFVNVFTKEKLILDRPEFLKADCLYSKQGWLLLRQKCMIPSQSSVVLLNPHSNAKITMPKPGEWFRRYIASFSSSPDHGNPECVVFDVSSTTSKAFYIAFVDGEKWTKHSYEDGRRMDSTACLVVRGHKVYCLGDSGGLFIFDMATLLWGEVTWNPEDCRGKSWIMESEKGEIMKVERGRNWNTFRFFKMNNGETGWDELSNSDLDNRSWFIGDVHRNHQLTVKETGGMKKLYLLTIECVRRKYNKDIVYIYDLKDGTKKSYKPDKDALWVDLGAIFKVPPSCVGYTPPTLSDEHKQID
ncbi:hypothetical protein FRX31_023481 [Thalictrum thalictroides]|uniref:KIB1-4 beta-propeller domain-containing protein n=1 Tax=Thalictrum thalictroides TaxID=46969 RepID=A0A7J6VP96_THATH|nr:hypothetical protein FRX31_023481 [Thalictrum thalictroides]